MQEISIIREFLEKNSGDIVALEETCPKCCPEGDDPDWEYMISNHGEVECAYCDCGHPLTPVASSFKALKALEELEIKLNREVDIEKLAILLMTNKPPYHRDSCGEEILCAHKQIAEAVAKEIQRQMFED